MGEHLSRMNEFIIRRGWFSLIRLVYGEVDYQRTPCDIALRYKAPIAAVKAAVPIVTHHEKIPWWNHELAVVKILKQLLAPAAIHVRGEVRRNQKGDVWKAVTIRVVVMQHMTRVVFLQTLAVHQNGLIKKLDVLAGQAYHTLDEVLFGISGVVDLVGEEEIADHQSVFHGFRGYADGLHHEGGHVKNDYQN